ncbi:MAG: sensor histidine kinase, partial [Bacteroidetes bacterium]|nr:sensor histidine kinase [Bacteroidota bacterium]
MKSPYLWILLVLLLIPRLSVAEQYPWIDSLRQKILQTPDSLKGTDLVTLGQYYWNLRENHPDSKDSLLKYARIAYQSGLTYQDTPVIRDGLSQMRNYYRYLNENEIADSLQKITQFYTAEYGYELPGYFNNNNEEAGYRYAHIYNTLYIYDATGRDLDFNAVSDSTFRDSFSINNSSLSKIKPESVYWMRLRLRGSSKRTDDYLFMIGYDSYSWGRAEIYVPDEEGVYQKYLSGNEVDPEDKPIDDWRNFFEVYVPQNQSVWVYIKVWEPLQVQKLAYIFLREIDRESLIENEKSSAMTRGIFHGVVSIQAIYFLLLFLSTRVRSYLFYVIYILGLGLFIGNANYFNLLFPHHGYYEILGFYLAVGISAFGMIRFGENFLDTREVLPRWRHTGNLFLGIFFFFLFLSMVLKTWDVPWLNEENLRFWAAVSDNLLDTMILICILGLILILIWGILAYRRGNESAKYFVIALLFLAAGFTVPGISKVFNISYGWITFNSAMLSVQAGIILQLSFFALGVGHKRKQLDQERQDVLKQANDKLRRADELKDEFLANTSHELRTPLNGIIGIAESLAEGVAGPVNQAMEKNLGLIISSGKRLAGLVNDLLDFSKLRSRELELKLIPIDLRSLVKVVLTMILPMVENKNIILKNEIPADLSPIKGDENRLQQVLFN